MKFLLDQDVYAATARFLRELQHTVLCAAEVGLAQATDLELLIAARQQECLLVTRDRHFGGLVFVHHAGTGVIYLRLQPSTLFMVHQELETVLKTYPEAELKRAFVVIEPGRHRFRRLP